MLSLFLRKASKLSTRKKGLKTNLRDVQIAGRQENNKGITIIIGTEVMEIGGKVKRG